MSWVAEHLSTKGRFIFDTPNRDIKILQSPDSSIDSDHKIEFTPNQLKSIIEAADLQIKQSWGLLPMKESYSNSSFNPLETYNNPLVCEDPRYSYLFAFSCKLKTKETDFREYAF